MPVTQTPFIAFFACNHGSNGFSEAWHLPDATIDDARATVALLAEARSFLLPKNYVLEWAAVRQVAVEYREWACIGAPLDPLPQWDVCDNDHVGLLWRFTTGNGQWANHLFRGVEDGEISDRGWTRYPFAIPVGPVARPVFPALATKAELYNYVLALFRDRTCHAEDTDPSDPDPHDWQTTAWQAAIFRMVSGRNVGSKYIRASWEPREYGKQPGFSPCGTVVTVLRSCYEQDCNFFIDGPTQGIRYYWSAPGAAVFPFQSLFWGWRRDKEIPDGIEPGERKAKATFGYSLGLSWGAAPGVQAGGTQQQFLGQTTCPWGNDDDTPLLYLETCDVPAPIPITVDDDPGAVQVLNVTHLSFHEDDFSVVEVAAGWARVRLRPRVVWDLGLTLEMTLAMTASVPAATPIDLRDFNAFRMLYSGGETLCIAGQQTWSPAFYAEFPTAVSKAMSFAPGRGGKVTKIAAQWQVYGPLSATAQISIWEGDESSGYRPGILLFAGDWQNILSGGNYGDYCDVMLRPDRLYWLVITANIIFGELFVQAIDSRTATAQGPGGFAMFEYPGDAVAAYWGAYDSTLWAQDVPLNNLVANPPEVSYSGYPALQYRVASFEFDPDYIPSMLWDFHFEMSFAFAEYTPPTAAMPMAIDFTLEPEMTFAEFMPPSASMSMSINFTLEPEMALAGHFVADEYGGAGANAGGGGPAWTNPGNAGVVDATYATATITAVDGETATLRVTNFGFALPGGATIDGIIFHITWRASVAGIMEDSLLQLVGTGVTGAGNYGGTSLLADTDTTAVFGSAISILCDPLTGADVNDASFGIDIRIGPNPAGGAANIFIDGVRLFIYYSA